MGQKVSSILCRCRQMSLPHRCLAKPMVLNGLVYTQHRHGLLVDRFTLEDALNAVWIDHDINHKSIQCIGQHLVLHSGVDMLATRHPLCFNPNVHYEQTYQSSFGGVSSSSQDKYPFATCHMFLSFLGLDTKSLSLREQALLSPMLLVPDANIHSYARNCAIWQQNMFPESPFFSAIMPDYSAVPMTLSKSTKNLFTN